MLYFSCTNLPHLRPHCDDNIVDWINRTAPEISFSKKGSLELKVLGSDNKASSLMYYLIVLVLEENPLPNKKIEKALKSNLKLLTENSKMKQALSL